MNGLCTALGELVVDCIGLYVDGRPQGRTGSMRTGYSHGTFSAREDGHAPSAVLLPLCFIAVAVHDTGYWFPWQMVPFALCKWMRGHVQGCFGDHWALGAADLFLQCAVSIN
jgi:hypothetical protein